MPILHSDNRYDMDACTAASIGDENELRQLLKINPNTMVSKNQSGWTPLIYAAYLGHHSVASFLLDNGAKVDDSTNDRWQTPLMMASACGNHQVVRLLLERGANPRICDKEKRQAIHYAASCCQNVVVDTLLAAGCDPNAADSQGTTPVHEAAAAGHEVTLMSLLDKGGNIEQKNSKGENAAILACDNNKILQLINEHQAETAKQQPTNGGRGGPRTLSELLEEMDLGRYSSQFKSENVDLEVFFELKEQDFKDMGIAYGPQKRMLDVIRRYKTTGIIRSDAFDSPQSASSPRGYSNHAGDNVEKITGTLRSIKELNQETKQFVMSALEKLGSGDTNKVREQLINILDNIEKISLKVSTHI
uniref:SAM domain-containing protein n=1 Tax=Caenorhabditis tropicalis TaxID=1561998 RepID=A0A1I7TXD4_9PELO